MDIESDARLVGQRHERRGWCFLCTAIGLLLAMMVGTLLAPIEPALAISDDTIVYVSNRSNTIHSISTCSGMKYYRAMTYGEAIGRGYKSCGHCMSGGSSGGSAGGSGYVAPAIQPVSTWRFSDTPANAWYVADGWLPYVVDNGIMTGIRDADGQMRTFNPDGTITRGQVATILFRCANPGSNATSDPASYGTKSRFSDVPRSMYYTAAIEWCAQNGIVTGYSGTSNFGPEDPVTREQLATMVYRYAKAMGASVTYSSGVFNAMPDKGSVSAYALDALAWCMDNSIITGNKAWNPARIDPQGNATRAQAAKIVTVLLRDVLPYADAGEIGTTLASDIEGVETDAEAIIDVSETLDAEVVVIVDEPPAVVDFPEQLFEEPGEATDSALNSEPVEPVQDVVIETEAPEVELVEEERAGGEPVLVDEERADDEPILVDEEQADEEPVSEYPPDSAIDLLAETAVLDDAA